MAKKQGKRRKQGLLAGCAGGFALLFLLTVLLAVASPGEGGGSADQVFDLSVSAQSKIRISEVMASNGSILVEDGSLPDWIKVENTGGEEVSLEGYALLTANDPTKIFTFGKTTVPAGESATVYADDRTGASGLHAPFRIPASGETLVLMNAAGAVIDRVETPELAVNQVYRRGPDGAWRTDHVAAGTNEPQGDSAVVISEVMTRNVSYAENGGAFYDYIEVFNASDDDVSLKGWYLSDDEERLTRWQFPDEVIGVGESLLIYCSGDMNAGALHTDFRLSADGTDVVLTRPDGQKADAVTVPALEADQAYSLADGMWTTDLGPTPGAENTRENAAAESMRFARQSASGVVISEVMTATASTLPDWIELYNAGTETADLSGWGLSDNALRPRKWQFPDGTTLAPGQYTAVFCTDTTTELNGYPCTGFSLGAAGGYSVTLSAPDGSVADRIYVPRQYEDVSYGRTEDLSGPHYFTRSTPLEKNAGPTYSGRAEAPEYTVCGGLYNTGDIVEVAITAAPGARIYYTLDCSDPTEQSTPYTAPITISDTTILRTRVYQDGCMPSFIDTQSYLYNVNRTDDAYVVSLVASEENLYGENGILSNYLKDIENEGHVEMFTSQGDCAISQSCGVALHGADSRKRKIKSFDIIARNTYGDNRFDYPIFSHRDYQSYQSFLLRPSGEDQNMSFMRDTVLSSLMRGTSLMFQEHEVVVLYLNGEYYTLCYVRERINEHSISQFEGWVGVEDDIDLVVGNSSVNQGSNATFAKLLEWVKSNDMTTDEAYDVLDSQIDIQNYIEYMSIQIFSGNTDTLNVRRYRCDKMDARWRWALYDLDWAFYNDTDSIGNWLTPGGTGASKRTDNTLFIACMKNPRFRDEFLTYFGEMMATTFSPQNVMARFEAHHARIEPVLEDYKAHTGFNLVGGTKRLINYINERPDKLVNTYFPKALKLSEADMQKYFGDAIKAINDYKQGKAGS